MSKGPKPPRAPAARKDTSYSLPRITKDVTRVEPITAPRMPQLKSMLADPPTKLRPPRLWSAPRSALPALKMLPADPAASDVDFSYLHESQRVAAEHAYTTTIGLLDRVDTHPKAIMIDIDGTLLNYRKNLGEPLVLQGRIVGLMKACHDRGIQLGIYSYWWEDDIAWLMTQHPQISIMVRKEDGTPLIRGRESINARAEALAMPDKGLHFVLRTRKQTREDGTEIDFPATECGYYDFYEYSPEALVRCPKLLDEGEILLDDHPVSATYDRIAHEFAHLIPDWEETQLAKVMAHSRRGLVQVREADKPHGFQQLRESERTRFFVALTNLQPEE